VGAVAAVLAIVGAFGSPGRAESTQSWPSLQGGPQHLGEAAGVAPPPLKQVWRSGPPGDARLSSVAIVPGLAAATGKARVVGLDPATGRVLWTAARADGPLGTPAMDPDIGSHGVIVFTEGGVAAKSAVAALDPSTQERLWTTALSDVVIGSPTIDAGIVFLGAQDRSVYAIDALSGKVRWKRITSASVNTTPAVAGGRVFVTSQDEQTGKARLSALDVSTGASRWSYSPSRLALRISSATVGGNRVYVGFNDQAVRAFDTSTGRLVWTETVLASFSPFSTLAFAGGSVYALDSSGGVYRFDARTGHRFWDYKFPANVTYGSPLVAGRVVYVGMDDGTVAAIDVVSGHLVWRAILGLGPMGAFAPADDLLLVPAIGPRGGIVAFAHDPAGHLIDETSPTQLDLVAALANFGGAFLVMTALILGLFRLLARRAGARQPMSVPAGLREEDGET
jgi:outer membrane protein assembly factor BamB